MKVVEISKLGEESAILAFILRNPVLFYEFVDFFEKYYSDEDTSNSFRHFDYQTDILCDFNPRVVVQASRSCGKTITLRNKFLWLLVSNAYGKNEYIFLTAPNKGHLKPLFDAIVRELRSNVFLSHFLQPGGKGINSQDFEIRLKNGAKLISRIAGIEGGERNVSGIHTPFIGLDEAGLYPWDTFQALQPTLNRHNRGYQLLMVGVPTGEKDGNTLYEVTVKSKIYSKHKINAFMNPLYTEEAHQNDIEQYGGKDSPDYVHYVLGEHGVSAFTLFSRENMELETYPVFKLIVDFRKERQNIIDRLSLLPGFQEDVDGVYFGIDLGYTDPTAIYVLKQIDAKIYIHAKIMMHRVPYPIQREGFIWLYNFFKPSLVGIDVGSAGRGFYQELIESDRELKKVIVPVSFGSSISIGIDHEGREIRKRVKEVAVNSLQKIVNDRILVLSTTDMETVVDLERLQYRKTPAGNTIYYLSGASKNNPQDHFLDALLCFSFAKYLRDELGAAVGVERGVSKLARVRMI